MKINANKLIGCSAICVVAGFALLVVFGIGFIIWQGYRIQREPVCRCRVMVSAIKDEQVSAFFDECHVTDVEVFVFQGHTNRPNYHVLMVGQSEESLDEIKKAEPPRIVELDKEVNFRSALRLCGAVPGKDEKCYEWYDYDFNRNFVCNVWNDWLGVIMPTTLEPRYLLHEEDKLRYLERYIVLAPDNASESDPVSP
ncbi:MAG: hypothetical protein IJT83_06770 [Victivallales bacterium]|nr:hypothetical protein [Victivallales bacterium]